MTTNVLETGARWWTRRTRDDVAASEANQRTPPANAYNDLPDSPTAYREQADGTLEKLFRAATSHERV
jgi:hypothetical protein